MKRITIAAVAIGAIALTAAPILAADADATGLVPTLRMSFDGQSVDNTGSGGVTCKDEGTKTYVVSPNGYAIDTSAYTPYGDLTSVFQANHDKSFAVLATLGSNSTGIMLSFGRADSAILLRRGTTAGSVVLTQGSTATPLIAVQNADASDAAYHLYVVNILQDRVDLYIDAQPAGTTVTTTWGYAGVKWQLGSRNGGNLQSDEARYGGLVDDLRVYPSALSVPQMMQLAVSLNVALPDCLSVTSALDGCGSPSPAYGLTNGLAAGQTIAVSCGTTPWTNGDGSASYSCTGWKLYDDAGNVISNGFETSFAYTHPDPAASRRLEWQWAVSEVRGTITAESGGSVSPSGTAMYAGDTPLTVTATPAAGNAFGSWTGTLLPDGIDATSASVTFTPSAPFDMTATFVTAFDFYVAIPANGGDDGNAGTSSAEPFATIGAAVAAAKAALNGGDGLATIHVAAGTYEETGFVLDGPIAVIGETGDPNDVEIVDSVNGSRAFTLSHALARVANLTVSGTGHSTDELSGGHMWMSDGTVENCVVTGGRIGTSGWTAQAYGGNVFMSGGRLLRCQVLNGVSGCNYPNRGTRGAGIYASGGIIDTCLVKDNSGRKDTRCGGLYVDGTAKAVNCTIVGNMPPTDSGDTVNGGVYVGSAGATVANCVIYGNGDGSARANFGDANLDRFFNCGSSVANESCATWKVLTDDDFAMFAHGNLRPSPGSGLVDAGDMAHRPGNGATLDLDGNARVSGESVDLGCYELDQSQLVCSGYPSSYAMIEQTEVTFHASAVGSPSDLVFRWDFGDGTVFETRDGASTYAYPTSGLFTVRLAASPDGGSTWTGWYTVPTLVVVAPELMYVDPNCETPAFPYKTKATAATTLAAALSSLTNNLSDNAPCVDGVEVRIVAGSCLTETGMRLTSAVSVVGETGDPSDVEIVDSVAGQRAFTLVHPLARVANLTVSGTGHSSDDLCGGHVWMSDGTVENCIVTGGSIGTSGWTYQAYGGNVFMSGGRLLRCQVLNGVSGCNNSNRGSYGAGVYASGGIIDTCLVKDNAGKKDTRCGGLYVDGTAKAVNCTIAGNMPSKEGGDQVNAGLYVGSADATVANCVIYGNGDGSARANFGDANLDRFFNCGSSVTNEICATWMVLTAVDFLDYAGGNLRQKRSSQIINHGTLDPACRPAGGATLDLDGNPRLNGRRIDLGCWEVSPCVGTLISVR